MKWFLAGLFAAAACFSPTIQPGSPCDSEHPCAAPLVCSAERCELVNSPPADGPDPEIEDASVIDALVENCEPTGFDVCGDGVDQDCSGADAACPANDRSDAPQNITGGGTFSADLRQANDDFAQDGCNARGGRDLFYAIALNAPEVYYFDTFGSNVDTIVRVFPGRACNQLAAGLNPTCSDDACGVQASQLAVGLPAGVSCVMVDQAPDATTGSLKLQVVPGGRDGAQFANSVSGNTTNASNLSTPPASCNPDDTFGSGRDLGFWFTMCPNQSRRLRATTCATATSYTFDTVVYLRKAGDANTVACNDDNAACVTRTGGIQPKKDGSILDGTIQGPGLGWVIVDGFDSFNSGTFTLTGTLE